MAQGHAIYLRMRKASQNEDRDSFLAAYGEVLQTRDLSCGEPEDPDHLHFDDGLIEFVGLSGGKPSTSTPEWHDPNSPSVVNCPHWQQHLDSN